MTAASPPFVNFGWRAVDFHLPDTKGKVWSLDQLRGPKGLLLMFICNHCEYVQAVIGKLVKQGRELHDMGFGVAAICSNDATAYPADSYEKMGAFARQHHLPFPYLHDASQSVARAYDAACTPDFFGFNSELKLQYRGRLDDSGRSPNPAARPELLDAMRQIAATGQGPREQRQAIGCSIKWKAA
jgi:peroxiredoxin